MARLWIFGLGYTASRIADRLRADGWDVAGTGRAGSSFEDEARVRAGVGLATHVLSSVPPDADGDPVMARYGDILGKCWLGYLSSTGVYGDTGGAWVDESAPVRGRRANRNRADLDWQKLGAHVFRLPGIYGPGRSALDRVAEGKAHRIGLSDQIFSRVHVDDIVSGVVAGIAAPAGIYNLADDYPTSQDEVIEAAAALLNLPAPPFIALDSLSPMARSFYAENRRVANGKAKRVLGWQPRYADFRTGLRLLSAITSPTSVTTAPDPASNVQ
ncbi:NAD(P)-dependent oxidoreductase [Sphingomonas sp.]|uniref:NAD(P)-dependent oxidoreductase n=1 Tax=Sphingomonas sp. TaxID=28214 RepID=UPI0025F8AF1F|nr:NAD(P)-dependent oxidoreductase [Sphingomonas sp.]